MRMRAKLYPAGRFLLGLWVLIAGFAYFYQAQAATEQLPIPKGVMLRSWHDNGLGGKYLMQLAPGSVMKAGKTITGTVTGDANCDADAQGLSHCHNTVKLANGGEITLINTHEMHRYRCLGPGDKVSLTRMSGSWVMAKLSGE